jgi:crossover junction endodeoxyribonuclease RuvC
MFVLGIDPGSARMGFGLVREAGDGSFLAERYGVLETPAHEALGKRLLLLYEALCRLISETHPQSAAVESLFFKNNAKTAVAVGEARGVALLALAQAGTPVFEYSPPQVKQAITGYGGAEKHQVQEMTRLLLDLPEIPRPDDAADALAIAYCHLQYQRLSRLAEDSSA